MYISFSSCQVIVTVSCSVFLYLWRGSAGHKTCCLTVAGHGGWLGGSARPVDERVCGPLMGFSPTRHWTLTESERSQAHGSGPHLGQKIKKNKTMSVSVNHGVNTAVLSANVQFTQCDVSSECEPGFTTLTWASKIFYSVLSCEVFDDCILWVVDVWKVSQLRNGHVVLCDT